MESQLPHNGKRSTEEESDRPNVNNSSPGNKSDDSGCSKETTAFSLMSTSWDEESLSDTPLEKNLNKSPSITFPPTFLSPSASFDMIAQGQYPQRRSAEPDRVRATLECQLARLTLQYHALAQNYNDSVARLRQVEEDNELLRKKNLELQASNMEYVKLITRKDSYNNITHSNHHRNDIASAYSALSNNAQSVLNLCNENLFPDASVYPFSAASSSAGLSILSGRDPLSSLRFINITGEATNVSPTSVLAHKNHQNKLSEGTSKSILPNDAKPTLNNTKTNNRQTVIPKSISIRSTGYLNMRMNHQLAKKQPESSRGLSVISPQRPHRLRLTANPESGVQSGTEGEKLDLEYDVYNQGMFKTELCNKWQDTGACPYGDRCQFAHGIEELRPVIRHPRYKTELCRMVAAGEKCPYGHRCHFRHSLSKEEKLAISSNNASGSTLSST